MDEYHRRNESGRYGNTMKDKPLVEKVREWLVPGSGKGVQRPQNKSESDQLKEKK